MRGLLAGSACAAALALGMQAHAQDASVIVSWGGPSSSCPYPVDNGCAAAPTGASFKITGFGTFARQSGQSWSGGDHPFDFNAPAVDYAIGPYGTLADPASGVTGCSYASNVVTCGGSGVLTIQGYDFSLHGGISINIINGAYTACNFIDDKFVNGANTTGSGSSHLITLAFNMTCNVLISSVYMDGNGYNFPNALDACMQLTTTGTITVNYSAILRCPGRPILTGTGGAITIEHSYWQDFTNITGPHGEIYGDFNPPSGNQGAAIISGNTVVQTTSLPTGCCTTSFYPTAGASGTISNIQLDHSLVIVNNSSTGGGANASTSVGLTEWQFSQTITNGSFTDNWTDMTGVESGRTWLGSPGFTTCTHAITFSGNHDLVSGAATNSADVNKGTGC